MSSVFAGFLLSHEVVANKKQNVAPSVEWLLYCTGGDFMVLQGNILNVFEDAHWMNHIVPEQITEQIIWLSCQWFS